MLTRKKIAIIAILIATGTGGVWLYAEQLDDEHEALVADQVEVVKAASDIRAGMALTRDKLTTEKVPRKFLPPGPLLESEMNIYLGAPLARSVSEGAMILQSDFSFQEVERGTRIDVGPSHRMIVKTASLELRGRSPLVIAGEYSSIAEQLGGWVESSHTQGAHTESPSVNLRVRVPVHRFDSAMQRFRRGGEVRNETLEGHDVSDKYVDLEAQARNQRALEAKLLTFVKTAKTVDDAISLEEKIQKYRMEAERLEGKARHTQGEHAMSTISVEIRSLDAVVQVTEEPSALAPLEKAFAKSAKNIVEGFAVALRIISAVLPYALVFGPMFGFGYVLFRRRRD